MTTPDLRPSEDPVKVLVLDFYLDEAVIKKYFPNIALTVPMPFKPSKSGEESKSNDKYKTHGTDVVLAFAETYLKQGGDPKKIEIIAAPTMTALASLTNEVKRQRGEKSALPIECPIELNDVDVVNMPFALNIPKLVTEIMPGEAPQFIKDWRGLLEHQAVKGRHGKGTIFVTGAGNDMKSDPDLTMPQNSRHVLVIGGHNAPESVRQGNFFIPSMGPNIIGSLPLFSDRKVTELDGTSGGSTDYSVLNTELLQINPGLTASDLKEILIITDNNTRSLKLGNESDDNLEEFVVNNINVNGIGTFYDAASGHGYIDRQAALNLARTWDKHRNYSEEKAFTRNVNFTRVEEQTAKGKAYFVTLDENWQIRDVRLDVKFAQRNIGEVHFTLEICKNPMKPLVEVGVGSAFINGDLKGVQNHQSDGVCFYGQSANTSFWVEMEDYTNYGTSKTWQEPEATVTVFAAPRPRTIYFNEMARHMPKILEEKMVVPSMMNKIDCAAIHSAPVAWSLSKRKGKVFGQIVKVEGSVHTVCGSNAVRGDWLEGNNKGNTLRGNRGPDKLMGRKGRDIYPFMPGDGKDTIIDSDIAIIRLEKGYHADHTVIKVVGRDIILRPCRQTGAGLTWNEKDSIRVTNGLDIELYVMTAGDNQSSRLKKTQVSFKDSAQQQHSYTTLLPQGSTKLCLPKGSELLRMSSGNKILAKSSITQIPVSADTAMKLFASK